MNNLLSYYGLVDVRINASDKDLPVQWLKIGHWHQSTVVFCDQNIKRILRTLKFVVKSNIVFFSNFSLCK